MIDRGLRLRQLGTDELTWDDFGAIVSTLTTRDSALYRAMFPDSWQWGLREHLLAAQLDALHLIFWSKTKSASKGKDRPKPIPRPGIKPERDETFGEPTVVSVEEMSRRMGWEVKK